MGTLFTFASKYFLDAIVVLAFGIISKVALKYFSNDRWEVIKENVLISMLWAEEHFGLGHGQEKWNKAWQKIIELLEKKGIKLSEKETTIVTDMMKSNVPIVNSISYSTVPEVVREIRDIPLRSPEMNTLVNSLKKKYPKPKKDK